jgi:tRNA modification GTPase
VTEPPTYAACLTPSGAGAIAALAVDGPRAWGVVRPLFRTRGGAEPPLEPPSGGILLGRLGGEVADEVVLTVKRGGPSPRLELHCHGGQANVRFLLDLLATRGLTVCSWQELEYRIDPEALRAAATIALAEAPTVRTATILLDQYNGAFAAALDAILAALDRGDIDMASTGLDALARRAGLGRRLTTPWRVTVAGAPNVGKSSLMNALAGCQRSIVSPTPGTTRDVVKTRLAIDGWSVELADTAGVREGTDALEDEGVGKARASAHAADLRLWVLDASAPPVWPSDDLGSVRFVVNKVDLPSVWDLTAVESVQISALTPSGIRELCAALSGWLVSDPPPSGAAVPFTERLCAGVEDAHRLLTDKHDGEARSVLKRLRLSPA